MAWNELTIEDLKAILSQDELDKLQSISTDEETDVVQEALDLVTAQFRGAFIAKGYEIDTRDYYMPSSYKLPALQYARQVIWSRFPNSPSIALDEVRKEQCKQALELLKDPYIGVDKPEWEHSSKNPDVTGSSQAGSITVPPLRFDEMRLMLGV